MEQRYGTLDRVLDHIKCDEILDTLRYMSCRMLPEPGYSDSEMRRIVPEVAVWLLLDGLIKVEEHGQDRRETWMRYLTATEKGQDIVWDLLSIVKEQGLGVNVARAHIPNPDTLEDYWSMPGHAPVYMQVLEVNRQDRKVMVQHPETFELYHANLLDIRFAKQATLEVKNASKTKESVQ